MRKEFLKMGKYIRKAKQNRKKGLKALKCRVGVKTRVRRIILKHTYQLRMANSQNLKQKANAQLNIPRYLGLRGQRLRKIIQYSKMKRRNEIEANVCSTCTPSNLPMVSKDGARNVSFLASRPQASLNSCMNDHEASSELTSSREMQKQEVRKHSLGSDDCLAEYSCVHSCSTQLEVSLQDNGMQFEQDHVSLKKRLKQKRVATILRNPSHVNTLHDQIATQASGTGPNERKAGDQRISICVCETLVGPPSRDDIEHFFAEAEQREQMMLTERYNFDFQNDAPLQGRYEWIRLPHS